MAIDTDARSMPAPTSSIPVRPGVRESGDTPLRILLVAPPMISIPPTSYAGTERVIAALGDGLHGRGHTVAIVAAGDSDVPYECIPTVPRSLWGAGRTGDASAHLQHTVAVAWKVARRFDIVHAHLEQHGFVFAAHCPTPVVSTLHGRLDTPGMPELLAAHREVPLVAISESQRRWHPDQRWMGVVHHGLPLESMPFGPEPGGYLAFVGRVAPEKGISDAIALARATGLTLRVAAKALDDREQAHFAAVVTPAIRDGIVEWLGDLGPAERDPLYAGALATVMLGPWPEPFGLVAIESMATGTPVIARRAGALTETIHHGVTGFLVDDVAEAVHGVAHVASLDRRVIRARTVARFSTDRMVDAYEAIFRRVVAERARAMG